ncbi:hypothetical protein BKP35_09325 [Anaerobacillus arseniciselenatis]|uniref:Peptidyl-prolyl cis-trans isomerase n=1 Tax=Anaerobacillus arseniciselenatis TaxID=85682 RepID=A0A1S2LL21_9BACI|nr:peptidylprolyl isomerase [Anaerobacillus arseniciselenatis]OIJ12773.1 hypothetical protein BKP35_09325 [Anaerobacillus arseniciselenatis]
MRLLKYLLVLSFLVFLISGCGQAAPEVDDEGAIDDTTGGEGQVEEEVDDQVPGAEEVTQIEYPQFIQDDQPDERIVKMVTNKGEITIRLFPKYAPLAVENFLTHSENGYYDGVIFHRVIEDFMVQTGDPLGNGTGGESIYGEPFDDEFSPALGHFRGALSMANRGPNTNGSQFFIVHSSEFDRGVIEQVEQGLGFEFPEETVELYEQHGGTPFLDYSHTVFGHVIEGMDVVDEIAEAEVESNDRPVEDIVIERIEILS